MIKTVAIVEDDQEQRENYADALQKAGYKIVSLATRRQALTEFSQTLPDLVILDIILGDEPDGGFDLCRELLTISPTLPIIFLTDRVDETDSVSGLRMGAWDYETKPISLAYLTAKVAALFRIIDSRNSTSPSQNRVCHNGLELDEDRVSVKWNGIPITLTLTEFRILAAISRRPGNVISYDTLMDSAMQTIVTNNTVNTHIRNIRKKFRVIDPNFSMIDNVPALGYRWKAD
jgi:two-component system OmpR family response regulator